MPLASLFNLQFYGTASGAMVDQVSLPTAALPLRGQKRVEMTVTVSLPTAYLKATRLRNRPLTVVGIGEMIQALPKKKGRMALIVNVNELTQDDVAGAVLGAKVEGDFTLRDILKVLAAVAAGKTTITDLGGGNATVVFRSLDDSRDAIEADMSGSERTDVQIN